MGRYPTPLHAALDRIVALLASVRTHRLVFPHRCDACGRTTRRVPASRKVSASGVECRRRGWRLRSCTGRLVKDGA